MTTDLFAETGLQPATKPLTVFRAELIGQDQTSWEELFDGFTALKAITFSSSIEFLLRLASRLDDMEIVFGAESILSREHLALPRRARPCRPTASPMRWPTRRRWSRRWRACSAAPAAR